MTKFSRSILIVMAIAAAIATQSYGQSAGIWGGYLKLQVTGGPDAGTAWFGILSDGGSTQPAHFLTPGATPTLNLGTITGLQITDAAMMTYKNGGADVTGAYYDWRVTLNGPPSGSFNAFNSGGSLPFGYNGPFTDVNGNTGEGSSSGDQQWGGVDSVTAANVLTGLSPGTYVMDVYGDATTSVGTQYLNNGNGSNYSLEFTIVPEPSSISLVVLGLLGAVGMIRRRKA